MFGVKDAFALLVIVFISWEASEFAMYLKDLKPNWCIPSKAVLYTTFEVLVVIYVSAKFGLI